MITFVGSAFAGGFQASVTVDRPEGVQTGDRMVMFASANEEPDLVSVPEDWAVLSEELLDPGADATIWVLSKEITEDIEDEPLDYTVEWGGDHWHFLDVVAFRGVQRIRTQSTNSGGGLSEIDLPSLQAQEGDALVAGGFHPDEVGKVWIPAGLTTIDDLPRSWHSAWLADLDEGPSPVFTLETSPTTVGLMSATAVLLVPDPEPPADIEFPLTIRTEIQLGEDWVDISGDVRDTDDVTITRGRSDWAGATDPASMTLILNNRGGQYSPRNPDSPHFGVLRRNTPIRLSLVVNGDQLFRFAGEVSEWPVRWDLSGNDVWVTLRAAGLLRRFAQGAGPERSAVRRFIRASEPLAYWPLTDGGSAVTASPDVGPHAMSVTDLIRRPSGAITRKLDFLDWAQGNLEPWMEPVAQTRTDRGAITGLIDRVDTSPVAWSADVVRARSGGEDRFTVISHLDADGTGVQWRIRMDFAVPDIRLFVREFDGSPSGTFTELSVMDQPAFFDDQMRHLRLSTEENGSDTDWQVFIDGRLIDSGTAAGFQARPAAQVSYSWSFLAGGIPDDAEQVSVGHIALWDGADDLVVPSAVDVFQALNGHAGERAGVRIARIAEEEGITLRVVGDLEQTPACGPQYAESALEVMRDAEAVDHGTLFEARDEPALVYRTNRSRFNQHLNGGS
jgi:hypothetical protein